MGVYDERCAYTGCLRSSGRTVQSEICTVDSHRYLQAYSRINRSGNGLCLPMCDSEMFTVRLDKETCTSTPWRSRSVLHDLNTAQVLQSIYGSISLPRVSICAIDGRPEPSLAMHDTEQAQLHAPNLEPVHLPTAIGRPTRPAAKDKLSTHPCTIQRYIQIRTEVKFSWQASADLTISSHGQFRQHMHQKMLCRYWSPLAEACHTRIGYCSLPPTLE